MSCYDTKDENSSSLSLRLCTGVLALAYPRFDLHQDGGCKAFSGSRDAILGPHPFVD